ncbi:tyrosine recombinase XerC [Promicromonospora sukumoe]|uniref:tyrosine recombinase XerC n=1 Tax=Promicromonospora sukumoe TaxID=88382 RepID=UPI0037C8DD38
MTTEQEKDRRAPGDGGLRWSDSRNRWIAEKTVGYDGRGKRIVKTGSGKSETAALRALGKRVKAYEAGLVVGSDRYTVAHAVQDWLEYGQTGEAPKTLQENRDLYRLHLGPVLGKRRLMDLRAEEVDAWLGGLTTALSTSRLKKLHSVFNRSMIRAVKRGHVERNVVELCRVPKGRPGRPSKSLTVEQFIDVLTLTRRHRMYAYIVLSMTVGMRPEEVRALEWKHVHLDADQPHVDVWRSVRHGGDTKTEKSRRSLELPDLAVEQLRAQSQWQAGQRLRHGERWKTTLAHDLVFTTRYGTALSAENVRRDFRNALLLVPSIADPSVWTTKELRQSFVSVMSSEGVLIEEISRLVGHNNSRVTELVYRKELRPVIQTGARAMNSVIGTVEVSLGDMEPLFSVAEARGGRGA